MKLLKGTRVEFTMNGEVMYGVVEKGGEKKVSIVMDGGERSVSGAVLAFRPSNHSLPVDVPSVMDKWGIVGYKCLEMASDETDCFEANITLNGTKVIAASNSGHGGSNNYYDLSMASKAGMKTLEAFYKDAKLWAIQFGWKKPTEPEDIWVDWYVKKRPYGVTAAKEIGGFGKQMEEIAGAKRRD